MSQAPANPTLGRILELDLLIEAYYFNTRHLITIVVNGVAPRDPVLVTYHTLRQGFSLAEYEDPRRSIVKNEKQTTKNVDHDFDVEAWLLAEGIDPELVSRVVETINEIKKAIEALRPLYELTTGSGETELS